MDALHTGKEEALWMTECSWCPVCSRGLENRGLQEGAGVPTQPPAALNVRSTILKRPFGVRALIPTFLKAGEEI